MHLVFLEECDVDEKRSPPLPLHLHPTTDRRNETQSTALSKIDITQIKRRKPWGFSARFPAMISSPIDDPTPDDLEAKFGQDADLYAQVRAEAAEASGNPKARKWEQVAEQLERDDAPRPAE